MAPSENLTKTIDVPVDEFMADLDLEVLDKLARTGYRYVAEHLDSSHDHGV